MAISRTLCYTNSERLVLRTHINRFSVELAARKFLSLLSHRQIVILLGELETHLQAVMMLYFGVVVRLRFPFLVLIELNVTTYLLGRILFSSISWTLPINLIIIKLVTMVAASLFVGWTGLLFIGGRGRLNLKVRPHPLLRVYTTVL